MRKQNDTKTPATEQPKLRLTTEKLKNLTVKSGVIAGRMSVTQGKCQQPSC